MCVRSIKRILNIDIYVHQMIRGEAVCGVACVHGGNLLIALRHQENNNLQLHVVTVCF